MSKLLIQESPLTFQPSLASVIGLNEAIVLQQIHYWISNTKNKGYEQDGYKWVYNTYKEWQENNFPFWSENTVQRVFASLEENGLVVSIQPMKSKYDRTKYYRIDYPKLDAFDDPKLVCSLNESETTTENTQTEDISEPDQKQGTAYNRGEQERPNAVEEWLKMANMPGAKESARTDALLSALGVAFVVNSETAEWKKFAKYAISEQKLKGWEPERFIKWVKAQQGYPQFWTCRRMMENYPKAFINDELSQQSESYRPRISA